MKIAMFTNNYKPFLGGVPISIDRLAKSLKRQGMEVVIFAPTYPETQTDCQTNQGGQHMPAAPGNADLPEEPKVCRYRSLLQNVAGKAVIPCWFDPAIEKEFAAGGFDLIHVHHPFAIGSTAAYLSRKYRVPMVFTYHTRYEQYLHYANPFSGLLKGRKNGFGEAHGTFMDKAKEAAVAAYLRHFAKNCRHVFAPTQGIKTVLEDFHCPASVSILPTGLPETNFLRDPKAAQRIRSRYCGDKKYLFCTVARLAKEKNLDFLLEALALFQYEKGPCFTWMVIGEGPEKARLMQKARRLALDDAVVFVGNVNNREIPFYCQASDVFLFSSLSETQGIVLLEAMAAGLPVVAVKASGVEDIVVDGQNGCQSRNDPTDFFRRLLSVLPEDKLSLLRKGALQTAGRYREEYIATSAISQYERIYSDYNFQAKYATLETDSVQKQYEKQKRHKGEFQWQHIIF